MLINLKSTKVFIYSHPVDMRKGHNGLSFVVSHKMNLNLLSGAVFLFVSKNRKTAKALLWDGTGLMVIHKRLEKGRFMSFSTLSATENITLSELALILEGSRFSLPLSPKPLKVSLEA